MERLKISNEVGAGEPAVPPLLLPAFAQPHQNHAPLIWGEGIQGSRGVTQKIFKKAQLLPVNLIQGCQAAQILIQEAKLPMDDNGLRIGAFFLLQMIVHQ